MVVTVVDVVEVTAGVVVVVAAGTEATIFARVRAMPVRSAAACAWVSRPADDALPTADANALNSRRASIR